MGSIRDIAGFTSRNRTNQWYWIVDGLSASTQYQLATKTSDALAGCPGVDDPAAYIHCTDTLLNPEFNGTTNTDGTYILTFTDLTARTYQELVVYGAPGIAYKTGGPSCCRPPIIGRLSDSFTYTINSSTAQDTPYIDAGTLTAEPGNTKVQLTWEPAMTVITEPGHIVYTVKRGGTAIATGLTGTSFLDTGLTNGTSYTYRVEALFLLDHWATVVGDDTFARNETNNAAATPLAPVREAWGTIAR